MSRRCPGAKPGSAADREGLRCSWEAGSRAGVREEPGADGGAWSRDAGPERAAGRRRAASGCAASRRRHRKLRTCRSPRTESPGGDTRSCFGELETIKYGTRNPGGSERGGERRALRASRRLLAPRGGRRRQPGFAGRRCRGTARGQPPAACPLSPAAPGEGRRQPRLPPGVSGTIRPARAIGRVGDAHSLPAKTRAASFGACGSSARTPSPGEEQVPWGSRRRPHSKRERPRRE